MFITWAASRVCKSLLPEVPLFPSLGTSTDWDLCLYLPLVFVLGVACSLLICIGNDITWFAHAHISEALKTCIFILLEELVIATRCNTWLGHDG